MERGFVYVLNLQVSIYNVHYSSVIYHAGVEHILYTQIYLLDRLRQAGFGEKFCFLKTTSSKLPLSDSVSFVYVFEPHLHHYQIPTETLWFQTLASSVESKIIETH